MDRKYAKTAGTADTDKRIVISGQECSCPLQNHEI